MTERDTALIRGLERVEILLGIEARGSVEQGDVDRLAKSHRLLQQQVDRLTLLADHTQQCEWHTERNVEGGNMSNHINPHIEALERWIVDAIIDLGLALGDEDGLQTDRTYRRGKQALSHLDKLKAEIEN